MDVSTQYARNGDVQIAYQVVGEGPIDLVAVPNFVSNIDMLWEIPDWARGFERIASFARVILFDRRGNGMSDGAAGMTPLEEQVDDVRAVLRAAGSEQPALLSIVEGCALAVLVAAAYPRSVRALILMTPMPRLVRGQGYEWAQAIEDRQARVQRIIEYWGSNSPQNPWSTMLAGDDEQLRRAFARYQRLAMSPSAAAAAMAMAADVDVRDVLPNVQCPTLVIRRKDDIVFDARHSRYVADHIPNARFLELPGASHIGLGEGDTLADEIQLFLTGARQPVISDRVLATVLFTDVVGSTERAAQLGDSAWRSLLKRHDDLVREEVERHRGRFVKSLVDGALAVFDGPSRAISSALAIRDGVRKFGVDIRAGLHTGECELLADDDIGGLAVHIGARVSSLAQPGEVLVSSTVRDLSVGSGHTLTDRGQHDLKGVPEPWRIFAVET